MAYRKNRPYILALLLLATCIPLHAAGNALPYTIDSGGNFSFTGSFLIYQIDDEYWSADRRSRTLDTRKDHTVRWQSMAYEEGNPVYSSTILRHGADIYAGASSDRDRSFPPGSAKNPYGSMEEALEAVNSGYQCRLHLVSDMLMEKSVRISRDCTIDAMDHSLVFLDGAVLEVGEADVQIQTCVLKKQSRASGDRIISARGSTVSFSDCEIAGNFEKSSSLIEAADSTLSFSDSGLTMQSRTYSVLVNSTGSKISVSNSRLTCTGQHATAISVNGGSCSLYGSSCTLWGEMGRMMEASAATLSLYGNRFTGHLSKGDGRSLYLDAACTVIQDEENTEVFD